MVFGDYGTNTDGERAVGRLAALLEPLLIVTTGDNSYLIAVEELLDENIFRPLRAAMAGARPNIGVVGDHDTVLDRGRRALVEAVEWPGEGDRLDLSYGPIQLVGLGLCAAAAGPLRGRPLEPPPKAGNPILPLLAPPASATCWPGTCTPTSDGPAARRRACRC